MKVYFSDLRASLQSNILERLSQLLEAAGLGQMSLEGRVVAVKVHFGEPGNLAFLRPNLAAQVVRFLRDRGARPFLTDTNTLYKGRRSNAIDHLQAAMENGYNAMTTGCQVLIADGLWGFDAREVEVGLKHFERVHIASAIAEADIIVSLNHVKGHGVLGFGGALKNVGMGCGSRKGKMAMHLISRPSIDQALCVGCGDCVLHCAHDAALMGEEERAYIDRQRCVGCGQCIVVCPHDAVIIPWKGGVDVGERMMEYAHGALKGKDQFHINFIMDVSPECDCWRYNDRPVVPDIGMAASQDPVALDRFSVDRINAAPVLAQSALGHHHPGEGKDKFALLHPRARWSHALDYAQSLGLGSQEYEVVEI